MAKLGIGSQIKAALDGIDISESKAPKSEAEIAYGKKIMNPPEQQNLEFTAKDVFLYFKHNANAICYKTPSKFFNIDKENEELIKVLCLYFARDMKFESYNFNSSIIKFINPPALDKGIMIFGNFGFGKSLIMKSFKETSVPGNKFYSYNANDVAIEYSKKGYSGIENMLKNNCYYDDLGTEEKTGYFEKQRELFRTIIEQRYNQFINFGWKTHISTNLDPEQIKERYGGRVESRIYEMFNIIVVSGSDRRKI